MGCSGLVVKSLTDENESAFQEPDMGQALGLVVVVALKGKTGQRPFRPRLFFELPMIGVFEGPVRAERVRTFNLFDVFILNV
jgi:hypothetical protein